MAKINSVERTSNPDAVKINLKDALTHAGPRQFQSVEEGKGDVLASAIFSVGGIETVFFTDRFITVNKTPSRDWNELEPKLIRAIEALDVAAVQTKDSTDTAPGPEGVHDEMFQRINAVVDEKIRPALEDHGGGLEILSLDGTLLTIRYQGACGGCPSAIMGTMMAIQNLLRQEVDPRIEIVSA